MSNPPDWPGPAGDPGPQTRSGPGQYEPDPGTMTGIVLRPIGSPMPLGYFTVAIDSVVVSTLQWGVLPATAIRAVALVVFPAFVVQLVVGLFALWSRDSIAGTLMMSFATTWLVEASIYYINPPGAADALGIFFIVFAVFAVFMFASSLARRAFAVVIAVAAVRFLVAGIAELTGSRPVARTAATLGFLLAVVALYTAFALLLEDSRGREILPIGRSGAARDATHGSLAMQLRGIEQQAGVRRAL